MQLEEYLKSNCERQVIDHTIRAEIGKDGNPRFYIHPAGVSGDTLDFVVTKNQLHPVYVWDGMQELADANPMTPELRAKLDAARAKAEGGHKNHVRADEHDKLVAAVNNLVEIVEGVRNVRWAYDQWRLKDTPEWCALYSAWSKQGVSDRRSNDQALCRAGRNL